MWGGPEGNERLTARNHIVSVDGTGDRTLPAPPGGLWDALATWSNDGTRLFILRGYGPGMEDVRPVVIPADGSSTGVEFDYDGLDGGECCSAWQWAPDDSAILGSPTDELGVSKRQVILDPETGAVHEAPWNTTSDPAWQRVAD
jgi:hypothetical protein